MIELLERIGERLRSSAYVNEAAITHGIVTPILQALGWDTADPHQVVPEFPNARGRVDSALIGLGQRPSILVEVKQVGRASDGDRQLFEYAFHQGVPLCVLTDGREWSFYLPSGQGSYDDRRVYRLQLDDRSPAECEHILGRYLLRASVLDQSVFENARRDHLAIAGKREALAILPRAWADLIGEGHELLIDTFIDKAEALCGYAPSGADALVFLRSLKSGRLVPVAGMETAAPLSKLAVVPVQTEPPEFELATLPPTVAVDRSVTFTLFGTEHQAGNASLAMAEVLRLIVKREPDKLPELAEALRSRVRNHIARTTEEIRPGRPDLARAAEIAPGWLVGLNVSNRDKMMIIRAACQVYGVTFPGQLTIELPNA